MNGRAKHAVAAAVVGASIAVTVPAAAAETMVIKIAEIKGDSADAKHKGEIDVLAWSWGTSTTAAAGTKAGLQNLTITKRIDSASPRLMFASARGQNFKEIVLTVMTVGGKGVPTDAIRIKLADAMVSSVKVTDQANAMGGGTEEVTFSFGACEYSFWPTIAGSTQGPEVKMTWNVRNNAEK
jgi:type VI secretion system secreted protein Hcp